MKLIQYILLTTALMVVASHGGTVADNVVDAAGNPAVKFVRFQPIYTRTFSGQKTIMGYPVRANVDSSNNFAAVLVGGYYDTYFGNDSVPPLRILMPPNDTNTYSLQEVAQLAVNASMFNMTNIVVTHVVYVVGVTNLNAFVTNNDTRNIILQSKLNVGSKIEMSDADKWIQLYDSSGNPSIRLLGYYGEIDATTIIATSISGATITGTSVVGTSGTFGNLNVSQGGTLTLQNSNGETNIIILDNNGNVTGWWNPDQLQVNGDVVANGNFITTGNANIFEAHATGGFYGPANHLTGTFPVSTAPGITTNLQFTFGTTRTNTMYFTNGILMRVSQP